MSQVQTHLPQRIRDHVVHRLHVEDGEARIDLADRGSDQPDQRFRRAVRADDERHADVVRHRHVLRLRVEDLRRRGTVQTGLAHVGDHADDGAAVERHDRSDLRSGDSAGPQRVVDDDDGRRRRSSCGVKPRPRRIWMSSARKYPGET